MNFAISRSDSIRITGVKVSAPEDSPNTDGIHITESTNVVLQNSRIGTGFDISHIIYIHNSLFGWFLPSRTKFAVFCVLIYGIRYRVKSSPSFEYNILVQLNCFLKCVFHTRYFISTINLALNSLHLSHFTVWKSQLANMYEPSSHALCFLKQTRTCTVLMNMAFYISWIYLWYKE